MTEADGEPIYRAKVVRSPEGSVILPDTKLSKDATRLFDTVVQDVVHQRRDVFDGLSQYERELVLRWLSEAVLTGDYENTVHDVLWEVDFWRKPVSIDQFVEDDYYLGQMASGLHPAWREDLRHVFNPDSKVFEWIMCLAGDTRVPLLDGTEVTLEELHASWEDKPEPFWVYSVDQATGEVVPGHCSKVTKFAKDQLYKVTLDDGTTVRANADHEFVCRDGVKRRLRDLKPGDRLMSFTTRMQPMKGQRLVGYEQVYRDLSISRNAVVRLLRDAGLTLDDVKSGYRNHRIVSIESDGVEHVYCLTVDEWANFAIVTDGNRNGIFSGNTGAIGIGKTTLACVGSAYKIHMLSCMRDPAAYYGLLPESMLVFGVYSITKRQVSDAGYHKLKGFIDTSPYFYKDFPRSRKIDSRIVFERKSMQVVPGSQELHALGLDLFTFLMDEVNFMRVRASADDATKVTGQAYQLYNATLTRMMSRFIRPGGVIPGLMMLLSSRNIHTSFLEERLRNSRNSSTTHVSDYRLWEVKDSTKFTAPKFTVEVGDRVHPSRILGDGVSPRKDAKRVEGIPGEFKPRFQEDIDQALRDIAGEATFGQAQLIRDRQSVFDAVHPNLEHPFTKVSVIARMGDETLIEDYFQIEKVATVQQSKWVPRINPHCPRFVHIDQGLTGDCAALAMSHLAGMMVVDRPNPDGTLSRDRAPFVVVDLMLQVRPVSGDEIDLSKLRTFMFYLSKLYHIERLTFDGWQSRDSMQICRKNKLHAGLLSVDTDDDAYLALRNAFFERRLAYYEYTPVIDELLDLERHVSRNGRGKVDHPVKSSRGTIGSKDVADALAGSVWSCLHDDKALFSASIDYSMDEIVAVVPPNPSAVTPRQLDRLPGTNVAWDALRGNL